MPNDDKRPLSIAEVYELPAGTADEPSWINDGATGTVHSIEKKNARNGKPMWKCTLRDPVGTVSVLMTLFAPPRFAEGDVIEITGQGVRRTEYQGTAQIELGKKSEVHVLGHSAHHDDQKRAEAASEPSASGQPFTVGGQTVGMALNNAIELRTHTLSNADEMKAALESPEFWAGVYRTASDVIRLARLLESGKLAEAVKVRADPQAAAKAAADAAAAEAARKAEEEAKARAEEEEKRRRELEEKAARDRAAKPKPQPGPGGTAFDATQVDDDVPF